MIDAAYTAVVLRKREAWEQFRQRHPIAFAVLRQGYGLYRLQRRLEYRRVYARFKDFTLLDRYNYTQNLALCDQFRHVQGAVVECGTWKGGMIAGIAAVFNDRRDYYLYDSFEGLPPAADVDAESRLNGRAGKVWQSQQHLPGSLKNVAVDDSFARLAMARSGATHVHIQKGWFHDTLPTYPATPIAILRADGDWYESTMDIFTHLYQYVAPGGVVIIDDYYYWDGCSKAVHDFLSTHRLKQKIYQFKDNYAYIIKSR